MKWIIIIILVIIGVFIVLFLAGFISAAFLGRKKNRESYAKIILAQLSDELTKKLVKIYSAFHNNNIQEVNDIVETISSIELSNFFFLVGPDNRPKEFSAGAVGNYMSWEVNRKQLEDTGYTLNSAKVLTEIILYDLDRVLRKLEK